MCLAGCRFAKDIELSCVPMLRQINQTVAASSKYVIVAGL
jgi:hypothetical protein